MVCMSETAKVDERTVVTEVLAVRPAKRVWAGAFYRGALK